MRCYEKVVGPPSRKFLKGRGWSWSGEISLEIFGVRGHFGPGTVHKSVLTAQRQLNGQHDKIVVQTH